MTWRDIGLPRVVLAVLVVLTAGSLVVGANTSTASFGVYNPAWDGASDLSDVAATTETETILVRNTTRYGSVSPTGTVAFILSPDSAYTPADRTQIREFVANGGTVVVAEDFGTHSNELLSATGATARFDGRPIRDERRNYQSPAMPIATNVSNHSLVTTTTGLTLNYGTVLQPHNATVLVSTSEYAYLDTNQNEILDPAETVDTYPVATIESVGQGRVIAVSDPSAFINAMLERPGNQAFTTNLIGSHDRLILDYSHADELPPLAVAVLIFRQSPLLQAAGGLLGIGVLLVASRRVVPGVAEGPAPIGLDRGEIESYLARQHPDWDRARIERVTHRIIMSEQEQNKND